MTSLSALFSGAFARASSGPFSRRPLAVSVASSLPLSPSGPRQMARGLWLLLALGCGAREAAGPAPVTPEAPSAPAGADVGAATPTAADAPPATPRELPGFCAGVSDAPPPGHGVRPTKVKDGFVFVEGPVW